MFRHVTFSTSITGIEEHTLHFADLKTKDKVMQIVTAYCDQFISPTFSEGWIMVDTKLKDHIVLEHPRSIG